MTDAERRAALSQIASSDPDPARRSEATARLRRYEPTVPQEHPDAPPAAPAGEKPSRLETAVRNVEDGALFGHADQLSAGIETGLGKLGLGPDRGYDELLAEKRKRRAEADAANPATATISNVGGAVLGGSGGLAGGATGLARGLMGASKGILGNLVKGGASALLGYEASAPVSAAADTYGHGGSTDDALSAAKDAATSKTGIALAGAGGMLMGAGQGIRARNRNVRAIEAAGGEVPSFSPPRGGELDSPLVKQGIDTETNRATERGRGKVARAAGKQVDDVLASETARIDQRMGAQKAEAAAAGKLKQNVDITDLVNEASALVDNPDLTRDVKNKVRAEVFEDFLDKFAQPNEAGNGWAMSAERANALKKKLQGLADFVNPKATDPDLAKLSGTARKAADQSAYGEINKTYKSDADKISSARGAFEFPEPLDIHARIQTPADQLKVGSVMSRTGQDTARAGMQDTPEFADALKNFPALHPPARALPLLDARSKLEFKGLPTGGLYMKNLMSMLGQNVEAGGVRLAAPAASRVGSAMTPLDVALQRRKRK